MNFKFRLSIEPSSNWQACYPWHAAVQTRWVRNSNCIEHGQRMGRGSSDHWHLEKAKRWQILDHERSKQGIDKIFFDKKKCLNHFYFLFLSQSFDSTSCQRALFRKMKTIKVIKRAMKSRNNTLQFKIIYIYWLKFSPSLSPKS